MNSPLPYPALAHARSLPSGFLWGASSSAHQTEGNNSNSNWWHLEQAPHSPLREASGAAVDSYRRYPEDMRLLAEAGLTAYRFSIEWARIEPRPGEFDLGELDHYRNMIVTARGLGLTPVVTLHHFTSPLWFTQRGGWRAPGAVADLTRYAEAASGILSDVEWICTINEPNMVALAADLFSRQPDGTNPALDERSVSAHALPRPDDEVSKIMAEAHVAAKAVLHERTSAKVGWTVSNQAFESAPEHADVLAEVQWAWEDRFLEVARDDDFVGVQAYTTRTIGPDGPVPHEPDPSNTLTGWPNRPDALGQAIRHTWAVTRGTPVLVTENGIATADDDERVVYMSKALEGLADAVEAGAQVLGYLHWSALDNYEWGDWGPTFGLIGVDRATFARTPRPSLAWLGEVARRHSRGSAAVTEPTGGAPETLAH